MRIANAVKPASRRMPRNECFRSCAASVIHCAIQVARASSDFCVILPNFLCAAARASPSGMPVSTKILRHRFDMEIHLLPQQSLPFAVLAPNTASAAGSASNS